MTSKIFSDCGCMTDGDQDFLCVEHMTPPPIFTIKDSGRRQSFDSGMVRDVTEGKIDYSLIMDGPMLKRWAIHLTNGAKKYSARNWMKASGSEELDRFKESAFRHFMQVMQGDTDEDHMAAVFFNLNGMAYVQAKMEKAPKG